MGLAEKIERATRFLLGNRPFQGEVLSVEHRHVGQFRFPVTLYDVWTGDSIISLSQRGHTNYIQKGDIIGGYRSVDPGAIEGSVRWYRIVKAKKVCKI